MSGGRKKAKRSSQADTSEEEEEAVSLDEVWAVNTLCLMLYIFIIITLCLLFIG